MADQNSPQDEKPTFETSDVEANRAAEQGLGLGARELAAQRDPGGAVHDVDVDAGDEDALDESVSVQGARDDDDQPGA